MNSVKTGRAELTEALQRTSTSADCYVEATRLDLIEAAWAARAGREAGPILEKARADAEQAVAFGGQFAVVQLTAAEVYLQIATAQPSRTVVGRGIAYVDQALVLNPRLPKAQTVRAKLLRLRTP